MNDLHAGALRCSCIEIEPSKSRDLRCFIKIEQPLGLEIRCRSGTAWVTQEGDSRDHVLGPGEVMRFTRSGKVLVSAIEACACEVQDADGQPVLMAVERQGCGPDRV